ELKRNPDDGTALAIASLMLSATGELQRESEYLGRLVNIEPNDVGILTLYAENLTFTYKYLEAQGVIERILRIESNTFEALALRGICTFNQDTSPEGQKKAEADLQASLKANPFSAF